MNHDLHRIQPYIDGELAEAERAEVEAELAAYPELSAMVDEQRKIRQVLRDLPKPAAPQALRARVLLELDAIDRAEAAAAAPAARPSPWGARLRALLRGAGVMLPAGAAALVLFVVARGVERPAAEAPAQRDLAVRILDVPEASPIREVSLNPGTEVVYQRGGQRIVVRKEPASGDLRGEILIRDGARYALTRDARGRRVLAFEAGGVRHRLHVERPAGARADEDAEIAALLEVGQALRAGATE